VIETALVRQTYAGWCGGTAAFAASYPISPMGMHSISVGYKEASKIRSAVGAAFVKPQIQLELFRTYGAPAFDARLLTQGHRFAVTLGYGHVAPMVLGE